MFATLAAARGIPIPDDVDGQPLSEAFTNPLEEVRSSSHAVQSSQGCRAGDNTPKLEEVREIEDRLRLLGYL